MKGWKVFLTGALVALAVGTTDRATAGDAASALAAANRLACAYVKGITAGFTAQGGVLMKPPLDPNTPGLTIDITDRAKGRAMLEEDAKETPGMFVLGPMGLTVMAYDPSGNVTLVTVYPQYSGVSDNFYMVSSMHGGGMEPRMMQRYGLCRAAEAKGAAAEPPAAPAAKPGHQ